MSVKIDRGKGERHAESPIPKEERTEKVRMLGTHRGSPDGIQVNEYQAGEKYDLPERLAGIFLDAGMAEEDKEETIEVKEEETQTKEETNETKTNRPADRRAGKPGRGKTTSKSRQRRR